ncbi:glycosyltransferase [Duganella sp. BJB488]|uniref:glycosyltransferase family 4 protein n=1 Tax=unclassified Duganella TaxID=2636909 RepID=UPI000E356F7B|nr:MULTISPECIES: glycosyltransferase [unclassified Duganella]NVD73927.1 glycosyltransferase [Duganella sp. BJB1802]RFP12395.1 glycosyltransferase [Duganella sp. BJB489]RFP16511.1 glycosyltransferase [Duganella sp. BJB488]RFP30759.1 glycosyltransferase [Duganella sp. BJB480]
MSGAQPAAGRPHVCFVALSIYPVLVGAPGVTVVGGAEVQQCFMARALARAGYRVTILTGDYGQAACVEVDGIRVLRVRQAGRGRGLPGLRYLHPRLTSVWRAMAAADADIYYQRCASALTGVVVAYARRHGRAAIFSAASDIDLLPGPANANKGWRDRQLFGYGLRHASAVVVQNPLQMQRYRDWTGRAGHHIASCYALPPQARPAADASLVLWVGVMRVAKQPHLVLDLAEQLPQLRFRLIGGPSSSGDADAYYQQMAARARTLPNVEFLGFVPFAEAEAHFDQAALLLNTSEIEGFPNTFLQAWARAVPSLSFFDCGARDAEGRLGAVVDSPAQMAAALAALMADPQARAALGRRCHRYYTQHHHVSATLASLEQLIATLMEHRR